MTPLSQSTQNPLKRILATGQSIWYDGLISVKEFERMIREDGIRGATTNPTIFEKAVSTGEYDAEISKMTASDAEIFKTIALRTVQEVADAFLPVFEETRGEDGYVSIEVSPRLAYDAAATIEEAKELHRRAARKNVMIKIPATKEGLPAIEAVIAEGIPVNVTLIFSVKRHQEVMEAYLRGLEKRAAQGKSLQQVASVASFFVSRVDTAVDKILESRGAEARAFIGKTGIVNSKAAYAEFKKVFAGERFRSLEAKGAQVQRPLWASTGTKNPAYSDVLYVEALMGPRTVDTAPPATLDAFRDHGNPASRLEDNIAEAPAFLKNLESFGVNLQNVTQQLEEAGVKSFIESYDKILQAIQSKRK